MPYCREMPREGSAQPQCSPTRPSWLLVQWLEGQGNAQEAGNQGSIAWRQEPGCVGLSPGCVALDGSVALSELQLHLKSRKNYSEAWLPHTERDFQALSSARKWPGITSLNTEGYLHWEKQIFISGPRRRRVLGTPGSYGLSLAWREKG